MKSIFEQNDGTYTKVGNYYMPNVSVPDTKKYNIGKFDKMYAKFIKQNKSYIYSTKMLNETWLDYLKEIDTAKLSRIIVYWCLPLADQVASALDEFLVRSVYKL